jgi:hypothetical protein
MTRRTYLAGLTLFGILAEFIFLCCCALFVACAWFALAVVFGG